MSDLSLVGAGAVARPHGGGDRPGRGHLGRRPGHRSSSPSGASCATMLRSPAASSSLIISAAVVLAPWIAPYGETQLVGNPRTEDIIFLPPQSAYWFGTDSIGRDMYSLILWGGRISLFIGLAVALSASIIGTLIGRLRRLQGRQAGRLPDALHRPVPGLPAPRGPAGHPPAAAEAALGQDRLRRRDLDPADHHAPGDRVVDGHGPHRPGAGAVAEGEGVHRGRRAPSARPTGA